jgi:PAS domain S-box-containing protein
MESRMSGGFFDFTSLLSGNNTVLDNMTLLPNNPPPIAPIRNDSDSEDDKKVSLSRHVTSVITHFTSSNVAYSRLLNEIDDFVHVISDTGNVLYTSPSVKKLLNYETTELLDTSVLDIVHPDDRHILQSKLRTIGVEKTTFQVYCRYLVKNGSFVLLEVKAKPILDSKGHIKHIIQSGRDVKMKDQSIDNLLDLRIENLRLKRQLEQILRQKNIDPSTHPLLNDEDSTIAPYLGQQTPYDSTLVSPLTIPSQVSPVLISPPVIAPPTKKRKTKIPTEELFCRQCGTTTSPEWRKGPDGPKT